MRIRSREEVLAQAHKALDLSKHFIVIAFPKDETKQNLVFQDGDVANLLRGVGILIENYAEVKVLLRSSPLSQQAKAKEN